MPNYTLSNFARARRLCLRIVTGGVLAGAARIWAADAIIQHGFESFSHGTVGNSGANLYVSRKGRVQVINKWDLNGDGYNDVVLSDDHDVFETVDAFIYWGSKHGYHSLLPELWRDRPLAQLAFGLMERNPGLTRLPAMGGGRSLIMDLNKDGYPDIVFCNYIHNYPGVRTACVYWGSANGYKTTNRTELPTLWAAGVAAADLNGDGYPDLVFANQGTEAGLEAIRNEGKSGSYIYWGSATGFDAEHPTELPTHGALDVTIADINHDGRPDIAFINNGPKGKDVQVFYGSASGYSEAHSQTLPVADPTSIRSGDLNRDGYADLVVTASAPPQTIGPAGMREAKHDFGTFAYLLMGDVAGLDSKNIVRLPTLEARDSLVGDFNHDGWPDIAIANSSDGVSPKVSSYVYWGGPHGFSPARRTNLPTLGANGVASADLNGDGYPDLVFANSSDGETHDVPSYVYWGSATGFAPYLRSDVQSFGAVSVNVADLNGDGIPEIVLVNQYSGHAKEIDTRIYWGNPHHYYSTASMTSLPGHGAYGTNAADLNDDGACDFVLCNSYQDGSYLYWGGPEGFSPAHRQTVAIGGAFACASADLNRDGYLDLVFIGWRNGRNMTTILWGSADGYSDTQKTVIELKNQRGSNVMVADLNRDGYLDLIYNDNYFGTMQILWGGPQGYSADRSWFHATGAGSLKLADLNGDGYLDFIVSGGFDPVKKSSNSKTRIFWGTAAGTPSFEHVQELEAYEACEVAVADLRRSGHLDLVAGNYMSDTTRSLPIFIFWGGKDGKYSDSNRLELPAESSCGIETLDLNRDGYPEIIVHNHLKDGVHAISSYIYWNGPDGFDKERRTELPAFGPHYTSGKDPGNLYTRKLEEDYVSSPLEIPAAKRADRLSWKAEEPHGTKLHFQIRAAPEKSGLAQAVWQPADSGNLDGAATGGWIQYRALFTSPDGGEWPVLTEVEIKLK
jgi:hypothetical protein